MKSITVLKLKLTDAPPILQAVAHQCRLAWNGATEDWLLRARGVKKESKSQSRPSPKTGKNGEQKPLVESSKLYQAARAVAPELGSTPASMLASQLHSHLGAKVDWRRGKTEDGKRPRRRDEILAYNERPPFRTTDEIPLHNRTVKVSCADTLSISVSGLGCGVEGPLTLDLSLREISPGHQLILRDLAAKTRKLADSKLVENDGDWFWHVPVMFETEPRSEIEAMLVPKIGDDGERQSDRPFELHLPNGRNWYVGDGRYLLAQVQRLVGLRKQIGWRYRQRMGAGHGRKKVDEAVRRRRAQQQNVVAEVRRRAIADIVRQCVRQNVGTLFYREPSLPLRKKCWFDVSGVEWDWTRFGGDLKNAAARQGIVVVVKQLGWKEAMENAA